MRAGEKDASQIVFCHIVFRFLKGPEYVDGLLSPDLACCGSLVLLEFKREDSCPKSLLPTSLPMTR